jgi:hypothetical protein
MPSPTVIAPSGVVAALRLLGGDFDLTKLRGDERYGDRMRIAKAARETDKVLADQCSYAAVLRLLFEALGVDHRKARPTGEAWETFADRAAQVLAAASKPEAKPRRTAPIGKKVRHKTDAQLREEAECLKAELSAKPKAEPKPPAAPAPLPEEPEARAAELAERKKALDRKLRADAAASDLSVKKAPPVSTANGTTTAWGLELRDGQWAEPRDFADAPTEPDTALLPRIRPDAYRFLQHRHTGVVMLRVGEYVSGGAVCLYNGNGAIRAGVVSMASLARFAEKATVNGTKVTVDQEELALEVLRAQAAGSNVNPVAYGYLAAALLSGKEISVKIDTTAAKKAATKKSAEKKTAKAPAKKAVAKKATEKKPATERATSQYSLVKASAKTYEAFTGQKQTIVKAIQKLGTATRSKLIAALPDVSANNISFYLVKWQKENILKKTAAAA